MQPSTTQPYDKIDRDPIEYTTCRDYSHISRQKNLRQVIHEGSNPDRFIALETANPYSTEADCTYFVVTADLENRLDLIAYKFLGCATYSWIIAYFNNIEDGYTCIEGQKLMIPKNITSLFSTGEILAPISALKLNLGTE